MKIADIKKEIKRIQELQFFNAMNDHWSAEDFAFDRKCNAQIAELKKELETERGHLKVGDKIKCHDKDEALDVMHQLALELIDTDFEYHGDEIWLVITKIEAKGE